MNINRNPAPFLTWVLEAGTHKRQIELEYTPLKPFLGKVRESTPSAALCNGGSEERKQPHTGACFRAITYKAPETGALYRQIVGSGVSPETLTLYS